MGKTPVGPDQADEIPNFGACAAWQPVQVNVTGENRTIEVYDCTVFGWLADLLTEIAKEAFQGAASSDKVATEVAKFHATSLACMNEEARINLARANPRLMPLVPESQPPALENKNEGTHAD